MFKTPITLFLLCAVTGTPHAAEADGLLTSNYETCKANAVSTFDMHACIKSEFKLQDARLNAAYKALINDLNPARAKSLREVQRNWIKFRDADCNFYLDPEGGTFAPVRAGLCMVDLTAVRAKELEDFLKP